MFLFKECDRHIEIVRICGYVEFKKVDLVEIKRTVMVTRDWAGQGMYVCVEKLMTWR